jgi:hypothetical protein
MRTALEAKPEMSGVLTSALGPKWPLRIEVNHGPEADKPHAKQPLGRRMARHLEPQQLPLPWTKKREQLKGWGLIHKDINGRDCFEVSAATRFQLSFGQGE